MRFLQNTRRVWNQPRLAPLSVGSLLPKSILLPCVWFFCLASGAAAQELQAGGTSQVSTTLPPITVTGEPLREEQPVGPYQQPDWTTQRRFATTRVYLQQMPGGVGVEQWMKAQWPRSAGPNFQFQEEVEMGLPHRFQFDVYENWDIGPVDNDRLVRPGVVNEDSIATELRYALADWGRIPFNPTLYGEWTFRNHALGADRYEVKLLLGDEIAPRWHWGANAVFEQEIGQVRTREYSGDGAISYTVIDAKLSAGCEMKIESECPESQHPRPTEIDIGPSIQWRPVRSSHIDVVPLVGLTSDSPHVELWMVGGFDFGPGNAEPEVAPVKTLSR